MPLEPNRTGETEVALRPGRARRVIGGAVILAVALLVFLIFA